ncbi:hypothetical protein RS030_4605 [Cryptosporidium xiaoi]|uniref:Uncharacterized protein n=1 Tax=Cryptosporidium xiaoi TaxID=659607 RepID=A0AAV9XUW7_9CRYT
MRGNNKKTILSLLFFGYVILNNVNCQKEEKTNSELRSLGHKRTIVEPYYVEKPVLVEQPVYYPYPYPYQYPYSFTYQYPYAYSPYSNYPYNYSYSYSRITRPAAGAMPPYPPPPPYLRYLGEKQENDEKDNEELIANKREDQELIGDGSVIFPGIQQGENFVLGEQEPAPPAPPSSLSSPSPSQSPSLSPVQESVPGPLTLQQQSDGVILEPSILMKKIETNSTNGEFNINTENNNRTNELPEVIFYNNSSELRMLGKKNSIIDNVEKTVDRLLDRIKIGNYNDDNDDKEKHEDNDDKEKHEDNEDVEKDELDENKKKVKDSNKEKENKDGNLKKSNDGKNNKNVIKQVFSKIEDIVTNTVN